MVTLLELSESIISLMVIIALQLKPKRLLSTPSIINWKEYYIYQTPSVNKDYFNQITNNCQASNQRIVIWIMNMF